jgi:hypothetical protein
MRFKMRKYFPSHFKNVIVCPFYEQTVSLCKIYIIVIIKVARMKYGISVKPRREHTFRGSSCGLENYMQL